MAALMRIVFFLFMLNTAIGWLNSTDLFTSQGSYGTYYSINTTTDATSEYNKAQTDYIKPGLGGVADMLLAFASYVPGFIITVFNVIVWGTTGLPNLMLQFGLPIGFITFMFISPIGFMVMTFAFQIVTGRSLNLIK